MPSEEPLSQIDLEFNDDQGCFLKKIRTNLYKDDSISLELLRSAFNDGNIIGLSFLGSDNRSIE